MPGPSGVHEGMDHEDFDSVPKAVRGSRRQAHLPDIVTLRLVRQWRPGILAKRGEIIARVEVTSAESELFGPRSAYRSTRRR